jgi:hypothetical protein
MPQVTRFVKRPAIGSSSRQRVGRNVPANQGGQRTPMFKIWEDADKERGLAFYVDGQINLSETVQWRAQEGPSRKEAAINRTLHRLGCMHSP